MPAYKTALGGHSTNQYLVINNVNDLSGMSVEYHNLVSHSLGLETPICSSSSCMINTMSHHDCLK